jgi:hypothetical protein
MRTLETVELNEVSGGCFGLLNLFSCFNLSSLFCAPQVSAPTCAAPAQQAPSCSSAPVQQTQSSCVPARKSCGYHW